MGGNIVEGGCAEPNNNWRNAAASNVPGGRPEAVGWADAHGNLWLFGGEGYDSTSSTGNGYLNDMWRYLP